MNMISGECRLVNVKAYYQKETLIETPIKTTNSDRVKLFCPGDLNLRPHKCGSSTFVLPRRYS